MVGVKGKSGGRRPGAGRPFSSLPMHIYTVGKPYSTRRAWPGLAQYNYRGGEHELVLFLDQPSPEEIQAARRGEAEFALFTQDDQIVLLYRFGDALPWSDAPYSIHKVPVEERSTPKDSRGKRALLHIILVDSSGGIIRALRVIALPPAFTAALHQAIQAQAALPFDREAYDRTLDALYDSYDSAALADMAQERFSSRP